MVFFVKKNSAYFFSNGVCWSIPTFLLPFLSHFAFLLEPLLIILGHASPVAGARASDLLAVLAVDPSALLRRELGVQEREDLNRDPSFSPIQLPWELDQLDGISHRRGHVE